MNQSYAEDTDSRLQLKQVDIFLNKFVKNNKYINKKVKLCFVESGKNESTFNSRCFWGETL